jgi:nucleoside-diphosphate-sugar epimerase
MSNPFTFHGKELYDTMKPTTFYGASGNHGVNYVSPNDIAEVAVRVLLDPRDHYNKEYTLTGPEAITDEQVAGLLSKRLEKPVKYVDQPLHNFATQLLLAGDPEWMVSDLAVLEKVKATGNEENCLFISDDIEKICGHKPQSFEEYLQETDTMTTVELGHELVVTAEFAAGQ